VIGVACPHERSKRRLVRDVSIARAPLWSVALTAALGAWLGHLVEYVRVAGLHAGLADMTSSVHAYFFPAGVALMSLLGVAALAARRAWVVLGDRLRRADADLRRPTRAIPMSRGDELGSPVGLLGLWLALTALQVGTWTIQENLEAVAAGHRAPLLAVMRGAHSLAPVVQAEVALLLAGLYVTVQRWFCARHSKVDALERLVARRWRWRSVSVPMPIEAATVAATPIERWGRQRWQRPPPVFSLAA
jgi:hypothetical protein